MSEPENFITRWSRRKLELADNNVPADQPEATNNAAAESGDAAKLTPARAPEANAPPAPAFDLTKLPSLESIGANSDMTAFLQAGVPSVLRHAALRRAWVADPAIRDFKGLADYDWDFTAPEGVPGFGELDPQLDIKKLVAEIFRDAEPETKLPADSTMPAPASAQPTRLSDQSDSTADVPAASEPETTEPQQFATAPTSDSLLQRDENIATQHDESQQEPAAMRVRRHGSAMPQ